MTNKQLLEVFEKTAKSQFFKLSNSTIDRYIYYINSLLKYVNNKSITEITNDDIVSYMLELECSDSYSNANLSAFKSLFEILCYNPKTKNLIKSNPTTNIKNIKNPKSEKKIPLTNVEQEMLLNNCKNARDYAILTFMLSTGVRIMELINITLEQYNNRTKDNMIELIVTKRNHDRFIFLNDKCIKAIEEYLKIRKDGCEFLFISNGGVQMDRSCISRTIKTIAKRSGYFDSDRISHLCNHLMRTTCLTDLSNKGVSIQIVAQLAGHSNIQTTSRYYVKNDLNLLKQAMCN